MVLPIVTFPHPSLRRPTEPVSFPLSKDMLTLTKNMIETVKKADGIGLAAPQVGRSVKLIVINLEKSDVPPFALYNPAVVRKGDTKREMEEGCLSIPGVFGMVRRPARVTILAQNMNGEQVEITDDGWISRVAQHEIDHINGKLIIDVIKKYTAGEEKVRAWKKEKLL